MGNCKSKARGDVITIPCPDDRGGAFRYDKDSRQIVYVGEDAETAVVTHASSQSVATCESTTENPTNDDNEQAQRSLLGEIAEFLEEDDESTVVTQSSRNRNSPIVFSHRRTFVSPRSLQKDGSMVNVGFDEKPVSPLAFEPDTMKENGRNALTHTDFSEDCTIKSGLSEDSSTLNGLKHVPSGEGNEPSDQIENMEAPLLSRSSSPDLSSEPLSGGFVATGLDTKSTYTTNPMEDQGKLFDSQIILLDDQSQSSLDDIESSLRSLEKPGAEIAKNGGIKRNEVLQKDYDEGVLSSPGGQSDDYKSSEILEVEKLNHTDTHSFSSVPRSDQQLNEAGVKRIDSINPEGNLLLGQVNLEEFEEASEDGNAIAESDLASTTDSILDSDSKSASVKNKIFETEELYSADTHSCCSMPKPEGQVEGEEDKRSDSGETAGKLVLDDFEEAGERVLVIAEPDVTRPTNSKLGSNNEIESVKKTLGNEEDLDVGHIDSQLLHASENYVFMNQDSTVSITSECQKASVSVNILTSEVLDRDEKRPLNENQNVDTVDPIVHLESTSQEKRTTFCEMTYQVQKDETTLSNSTANTNSNPVIATNGFDGFSGLDAGELCDLAVKADKSVNELSFSDYSPCPHSSDSDNDVGLSFDEDNDLDLSVDDTAKENKPAFNPAQTETMDLSVDDNAKENKPAFNPAQTETMDLSVDDTAKENKPAFNPAQTETMALLQDTTIFVNNSSNLYGVCRLRQVDAEKKHDKNDSFSVNDLLESAVEQNHPSRKSPNEQIKVTNLFGTQIESTKIHSQHSVSNVKASEESTSISHDVKIGEENGSSLRYKTNRSRDVEISKDDGHIPSISRITTSHLEQEEHKANSLKPDLPVNIAKVGSPTTRRESRIPRMSTNSQIRRISPYRGERKSSIPTPSPVKYKAHTPPTSLRIGPIQSTTDRSSTKYLSSEGPQSKTSPLSSTLKSKSARSPAFSLKCTPDNQCVKVTLTLDSATSSRAWTCDQQHTPLSLPWDENDKNILSIKKDNERISPRLMATDVKNSSEICAEKWDPYLHDSKGGCERCLTLCSSAEKQAFFKHGRHQRVTRTRGGCTKYCKRYAGERFYEGEAAALCRICFHAVHRKTGITVKDNTVRPLE